MKPRAQLLLGVLNSIATALAMLIMAPVYLKYLGAEAFGLIGFYTTLLMCMQVFDMGMATTLNREIARHGVGRLSDDNAQLLRCVELIYATISIALVLAMWILGAWFAKSWFTAKHISGTDITYALYGIATCVALRLPINVYQSALFGAQKMHLASAIGIIQIIAGALGGYMLLRFYSADVVTFFVWQVVIALLHLVSVRALVWRNAPKRTARNMDWRSLSGLWRYAVGAGLVSVAGLVLSQVDKVVLSKTLDLEHYGYYMLASTLAASVHMLSGPFYNVFFPLASKLIESGQSEVLLPKYQFFSASLAACVFPFALYLMLLFPKLLNLWISDQAAVDQISPIATILVIATSLHALMFLPHALVMAMGISRSYLTMYGLLIGLSVPVTVLLSIHFGAVGGALAQVALFVIHVFYGAWITHRICFKGYAISWLFKDVGRPLGVVMVFGFIVYTNGLHTSLNFDWIGGLLSIVAWMVVFFACVLVSPSTRNIFFIMLRGFRTKLLTV